MKPWPKIECWTKRKKNASLTQKKREMEINPQLNEAKDTRSEWDEREKPQWLQSLSFSSLALKISNLAFENLAFRIDDDAFAQVQLENQGEMAKKEHGRRKAPMVAKFQGLKLATFKIQRPDSESHSSFQHLKLPFVSDLCLNKDISLKHSLTPWCQIKTKREDEKQRAEDTWRIKREHDDLLFLTKSLTSLVVWLG